MWFLVVDAAAAAVLWSFLGENASGNANPKRPVVPRLRGYPAALLHFHEDCMSNCGLIIAVMLLARCTSPAYAFTRGSSQRLVHRAVSPLLKSASSASLTSARRSTATTTTDATDATDAQRDSFYITTPIFYVNGKPHLGHAYTAVASDVIARFERLKGKQVKFLSGTDEHGLKVEQFARRQNRTPIQVADYFSASFRRMMGVLECSNDDFIRTTEPRHIDAVRAMWEKLVAAGFIYKGVYEGWYSVVDECFYTESELVDGRAPTGAEVQWVSKEESYFFRLSAFEERLTDWLTANPDVILPESRRNEALSFIRGGLRDISISRTSFKWGVPVPGDEEHVIYVWLDALMNYLAAVGYPNTSSPDFQKFWPADLHVVGKDILRFHAVFWPALLMAADLPLPKRLFVHGWWLVNGAKMSKSLGNVQDPFELVEKYGAEPLRWFLLSDIAFGSDGDFSEDALVRKANAFLADEYGNLVQRALAFAHRYCDKQIPACHELSDAHRQLLELTAASRDSSVHFADSQAVHRYCSTLVQLVRACNKFVDDEAPWHLAKSDKARMETSVYVLLEALRRVAILFAPVLPTSSSKVLDMLAVPEAARTLQSFGSEIESATAVRPGTAIAKPQPLFQKFKREEPSR